MNSLKKITLFFLIWRLLLFIPVVLGIYFIDYGSSFPFFEITYQKQLPFYLDLPFLKAWSNFDGVHYLNIASDGYLTGGRFFPLFPIVLWFLSFGAVYFPFTFLVSLIIPNLLFLAALFILINLLKLDYPEKISNKIIPYLILYPASYFFVSVYSEGLFLLLTLLSFYFARKRKWYFAAFFAMFLTASRFVGIVIIPALILEYVIIEKPKNLKSWMTLFLVSAISCLGLIAYSIYNYFHWGNFLHFISAQGELNNGRSTSSFILPPQTIYRYFKILTSLPFNLFEWWIALLELISFVFGAIILAVAWVKKVRLSYLVFGILAFLFPTLSGTFSGLPRYLLVIFPIFLTLALIENKYLKLVYYLITPVLLCLLLMFFTKGHFIA